MSRDLILDKIQLLFPKFTSKSIPFFKKNSIPRVLHVYMMSLDDLLSNILHFHPRGSSLYISMASFAMSSLDFTSVSLAGSIENVHFKETDLSSVWRYLRQ